MRNDYPYSEAIDDLIDFVNRKVKDLTYKTELLEYLEKCRKSSTVTFRHIYEKYVEYTNVHSDFRELSDEDKEMIDDLSHFWG